MSTTYRLLGGWLLTLLAASLATAADAVPWQADLESAQRMAAQSGRLVLVHFWAPWCRPCMRMESEVFARPETARGLAANFVPVKLNVDDSPSTARLYGVSTLPSDVILTAKGQLVAQLQSPPTASQYVNQLNQFAGGYKQMHPTPTAPAVHAQPPMVAQAPAAQAPPAQAQRPVFQPTGMSRSGQSPFAAMPPSTNAGLASQTQTSSMAPPSPGMPAMPGSSSGFPSMQASTSPTQPQVGLGPPMIGPGAGAMPSSAAAAPAGAGFGMQAAVATPPHMAAKQLPLGSPPLGLEGYCPVSLVEHRAWKDGDTRWGAVHNGRTYLFAGPDEQKKFLASPNVYCPVLAGDDPVRALDEQQQVPGKREYGVYYENRVYLFADPTSRDRFSQNPRRYAAEVVQAMRKDGTARMGLPR